MLIKISYLQTIKMNYPQVNPIFSKILDVIRRKGKSLLLENCIVVKSGVKETTCHLVRKVLEYVILNLKKFLLNVMMVE